MLPIDDKPRSKGLNQSWLLQDCVCVTLDMKHRNKISHHLLKQEMTPAWLFIYPWASWQIRKFAGAHAPGMPGTFSPSPQVSDPDMHHGTCVTHVPWCMPGSLTSGFLWNRRRGKTFPAFPAHAQPAILRIWQEAHEKYSYLVVFLGV